MNVASSTSVFKSRGRPDVLNGDCQHKLQPISQMDRNKRPHRHFEMHPRKSDLCQLFVFPFKCLDNLTGQDDILWYANVGHVWKGEV